MSTSTTANWEVMGELKNLGFPIFLFIVSISSLIWFLVEIKKKRLELKTMIAWFILNLVYTITVLYVLIISILHYFYIDNAINIFNYIAYNLFGINMEGGKEWVILLILGFISYILIKSLHNSIKISKLNIRVDELSKDVAILSGKVNKSADLSTTEFRIPKNSKEVKIALKEKIKVAKLEAEAAIKLEEISDSRKNDFSKK